MTQIADKQEFYRLSRSLQLGNILQQWTWAEFESTMVTCPDSLPEVVGVRHVRKSFTHKGVSGLMYRQGALAYGRGVVDRATSIFIDEGAVHGNLTIQGELMTTEQGLYVRYSSLQVHQRTLWHIDQFGLKGLKKFQLPHNLHIMTADQKAGRKPVVQHAFGLKASALLKTYMDHTSWDKVHEILHNFHYPVIEFACFNRPLGLLKWNTLIWEVRTRY